MTLSEAEITTQIKEVLNLSYLPLTGKDIQEFILERVDGEVNENTFKVVIRRLADNREIKSKKIPGRKFVFYSTADRPETEGHIEIYMFGKYINFSSRVEEAESPDPDEDGREIVMEELLQGVGLIDYYCIRKFCGIHQYSPGSAEKGKVQRAKKVKWVSDLTDYLQASDTTMMTTAIVFLDQNDPIELELVTEDIGGYGLYKLTIPYGGSSFDENKIAWILDGQQRMWATDFIAIQKNNITQPIIAPISVAVGDFNDSDPVRVKRKMDLIRKIFIVSNQTEKIPEMWKRSIITKLDSGSIPSINRELSKFSTYERIARRLNEDDDSPFQDFINLEDITKKRSDTELITLGNMIECVKYMTEQKSILTKGFFYDDDVGFKGNLARIKDYYNTIKIVWKNSWDKQFDENNIKSAGVLFTFAFLSQEFGAVSVRRKSRQELIKDHFIPTLLVLKNMTDFDTDDPLVSGLKYGKKYALDFSKEMESFLSDFMEELDDDEIDRIFNEVIGLYSKGSPSHF